MTPAAPCVASAGELARDIRAGGTTAEAVAGAALDSAAAPGS